MTSKVKLKNYQILSVVFCMAALLWFIVPTIRFYICTRGITGGTKDYQLCFYDTGVYGYLPHISLLIVGILVFLYGVISKRD